MLRLIVTAGLTAAAAMCQLVQLTPNTLSVSVSKSLTLPPDKVSMSMSVNMPLDSTIEQAVQIFAPVGVTSADLQNLSTSQYGEQDSVVYSFAIQAPYGKQKTILDGLAGIRKRLQDANSSNQIDYRIDGFVANQQYIEDNRADLTAALVSDARKKAQAMAQAAGMTLGRIQNLSDISYYFVSGYYYGSSLSGNIGMTVTFNVQ